MLIVDEVYVDKESYQSIWDKVINPTIKDYQERFAEVIVKHNAQDVIWQEYVWFNRHTKERYMQDAGGTIRQA